MKSAVGVNDVIFSKIPHGLKSSNSREEYNYIRTILIIGHFYFQIRFSDSQLGWISSIFIRLAFCNSSVQKSCNTVTVYCSTIACLIIYIYKQQVLHSHWLKTCQLILNQCKKVEIECKTVKSTASCSDKQNGEQKLNENWNSLSKTQYHYPGVHGLLNYLITKQSAKLNNNQ